MLANSVLSTKSQQGSKRKYQVGEQILQILATCLRRKVVDPRLSTVTFTAVDLSPDFKRATVFYTALEDDAARLAEIDKALQRACGFFRSVVARQGGLRHTPQLQFQYDQFISDSQHLVDVLAGIPSPSSADLAADLAADNLQVSVISAEDD